MNHAQNSIPMVSCLKQRPRNAVLDELLLTFNHLHDDLISTLWFILGNHDDACDAAQDAFLKCWKSQARLREVRNLRSWIFRIAYNVARDYQRTPWYRHCRQFAGEELRLVSLQANPAVVLETTEMHDRLREELVFLRPSEKEVFLLRQNGGLTFEEIAEIRDCPLGTVKTQMRRALQRLRRRLD